MIRYVTYRNHFGVEQICRVLARTEGGFMTSRGYRAAKNRPLSDCAVRDQVLGDDIERLHAANFGVYGVRKMHRLMKRQGWLVGRDQVARVMKTLGITGVKRARRRSRQGQNLPIRIRWIKSTASSGRRNPANCGWPILRIMLSPQLCAVRWRERVFVRVLTGF